MSYDFHIVNDQAKLIEINTNASSYTVGNILSEVKKNQSYIEPLKESFAMDISLSQKEVKHIAIIDENPHEQNLYLEFLIYKNLFESWGYSCSINDVLELQSDNDNLFDKNQKKIDYVYNRYCDFYLTNDRSKKISKMYLQKNITLSPQPLEYFLLADKQRMIDWQNIDISKWCSQDEMNVIKQTLLTTNHISSFSEDELWKNKKLYFFKPKSSFGGKSVYRGKNVTTKVFKRLLTEDILVQEIAPAPKIEIDDQQWKYDLRVYCYKDKIDQVVARTYRGQTTNASTLGGGISLVNISN